MSVYVCLSVCLSVREHISRDTRQIFTKIGVHVTAGRGSVLLWRHCDELCTSGFMNDVVCARNAGHMGHVDTVAASDIIAWSCAG